MKGIIGQWLPSEAVCFVVCPKFEDDAQINRTLEDYAMKEGGLPRGPLPEAWQCPLGSLFLLDFVACIAMAPHHTVGQ